MISKLSREATMEFFGKQRRGNLGCILDSGEPYVIPVNYLVIDDEIVIHSLVGQKIDAMRKRPRICLQTDSVKEGGLNWQSAIVFGRFEELRDHKEKSVILSRFYDAFPRLTPVEARVGDRISIDDMVVFRIAVERVSGISEGLDLEN